MDAIVFIIGLAIAAVVLVGIGVMIASFYKKVDQGQALIVNMMRGEPIVTFTGHIVYPIIHRAETMEISVKTIELSRRGNDGLICKDNIRADIKVSFYVRVNKTQEDVLKVAQAIGCARASDQKTLEELFVAKFSEALKTVGKRLDFVELYTQRDDFKDQLIEVIGRDLNGYILDDAAIDYLEQTPLELLDKENILDSQGIRKITKITSEQNMATNDLRQTERKELSRQNLEADEAILELEKRKADAVAKQQREISNVQAREKAEIDRVAAEEHRKAQLARIQAAEQIQLGEVNKSRQLEVAEKDKERVVAIKHEQVTKDRDLEIISREREVELNRIAKERALEVEKKNIAEVVRARIAVDKNVAEEEEAILTLRATESANRDKVVVVMAAEAEAEEGLIKEIKAAEASEKKAEYEARERLVLAHAALEAADKEAQAKIRLAEGTQAQEAASGLAEARVEEAKAVALEKTGLAKAKVTRETMLAEAEGAEKKGLADAKVKDVHVDVVTKEGKLKAEITRDQGEAAADNVKARLLAEATGKEADAAALAKVGEAQAAATRAKMLAEADGIEKKAQALQNMDGAAKEHEEFRLSLEKAQTVEMAAILARQKMAMAQAQAMGVALASADLKIIGGAQEFVNQYTGAASAGESIDGLVSQSDALQDLLKSENSGNLVTNAALAAGLVKLLDKLDGPAKAQIQKMLSSDS